MASTGKTRDVQCRKCWGYGHIERECRTKRVMMVREDGQYDSASDFDEDTLALISARDGDNSDSEPEMEVMGAETADKYQSLVAQRDKVLVPLDMVWTLLMARSFTDSRRGEMNTKNGEEHGRKSGIQTHTTHTPVALVGPIHQLNRTHKGKAKGKVPCGWIAK